MVFTDPRGLQLQTGFETTWTLGGILENNKRKPPVARTGGTTIPMGIEWGILASKIVGWRKECVYGGDWSVTVREVPIFEGFLVQFAYNNGVWEKGGEKRSGYSTQLGNQITGIAAAPYVVGAIAVGFGVSLESYYLVMATMMAAWADEIVYMLIFIQENASPGVGPYWYVNADAWKKTYEEAASFSKEIWKKYSEKMQSDWDKVSREMQDYYQTDPEF
jgi:hypothetical protein